MNIAYTRQVWCNDTVVGVVFMTKSETDELAGEGWCEIFMEPGERLSFTTPEHSPPQAPPTPLPHKQKHPHLTPVDISSIIKCSWLNLIECYFWFWSKTLNHISLNKGASFCEIVWPKFWTLIISMIFRFNLHQISVGNNTQPIRIGF